MESRDVIATIYEFVLATGDRFEQRLAEHLICANACFAKSIGEGVGTNPDYPLLMRLS